MMNGLEGRGRKHPAGDRPWSAASADASLPRARRRTLGAISDVLSRLLAADEAVLDFTEAIDDAPIFTRAVLGAAWAPWHRVAIVFTPRRIVEIGLDAKGRRAFGRVRSFLWDRIATFVVRDEWLEIGTWDEELHRWYLRDLPDPAIQGRIHRSVDLAVSAYGPAATKEPVLHCSVCGVKRHGDDAVCSRCGAVARRSGRASRLAIALPGGGQLYAGRRVSAILHFALESLVFAVLAGSVLLTTDVWRVATIMGIGFAVLGPMKLHAIASARRLAGRGGSISRAGDRLWLWVQPIGMIISIVALLAPLFMVGALDKEVNWDLAFAATDGSWSRAATSVEEPGQLSSRSALRHRDGALVEVRAWPFEPFESSTAALVRIVDSSGATVDTALQGPHSVLTAIELISSGTGQSTSRVTMFIVDSAGRDVHALSTVADDPSDADRRLRDLIRRAYWVRPIARPEPEG